jgi:chitinase
VCSSDLVGFWVYHPSQRVFWSYDDATAVGTKMAYVLQKGLGGAMVWSLDGDDDSGTLLRAIRTGLTPAAKRR